MAKLWYEGIWRRGGLIASFLRGVFVFGLEVVEFDVQKPGGGQAHGYINKFGNAATPSTKPAFSRRAEEIIRCFTNRNFCT
jgi:hypothetical protein